MKRLSSSKHSHEPVDKEFTTQKAKFASLYEDDDSKGDEEAGGCALRQKYKKTWKISSSKNGVNNQQQQEKFVCSKCKKTFQSLKAKCGHMASHSQKVQSSILVAKQKLAMDDSQSDTESVAKRKRRSRRARYKKHHSVDVVGSKAKVDVSKDCSSEDSGVEQEEVAISLMMLSRDLTNSVVLEARSISTKLAAHKDGPRSRYQMDATTQKYDGKKIAALRDSESAFVRNYANSKSVETEVKVPRNLKTNKFDEGLTTEPHLKLKKVKRVMDAGMIRDGEGYNQTLRSNMDLYMKKSAVNELYIAGYSEGNRYSISEMYQRFEQNARIHSQSIQTFTAREEDHGNFTVASSYESSENSFEIDAAHDQPKGKGILENDFSNVGHKWKKGKHEHPVCFKIFKSGQALGGNRRVDKIKSHEFATNFKRSGTHSHVCIDLNLPAPMEDDEACESMASYI